MKDIIINKESIQRELKIWLISFLIALILNVIAIILYDASWWELITELHYVFVLSVVVFIIIFLLKITIRNIMGFLKKL
ncbi:MAG: hypothetical protein RDU14_10255 [Melioribacteraceae bacterium]|nr:hypothetical protein [Melioribacteraceae bacterium]